MRLALYARCSASDQSVDLQLGGLRDYAKVRRFDMVEEYVDEAMSGAMFPSAGLRPCGRRACPSQPRPRR